MKIQQNPANQKIAGRRVLIVDDDKDFAQSLSLILSPGYSGKPYETTLTHSLAEALEAAQKFPIQVALLDIRLGSGNGVDLIPGLKKIRPNILCVMVTAFASLDTSIKALREGAYDYLRKPIYPNDLFATLDRCFEKIEAETALRENQEYIRAILDKAVDGIITTDARGVIQSFNPAAERIFGYPAGEAIGENLKQLLSEDCRPEYDRLVQNRPLSEKNKAASHQELTGLRKNRSAFPLELSIGEFRVDSPGKEKGSPPGRRFIAMARDIAERKRAEEALRKSEEWRKSVFDYSAAVIYLKDLDGKYIMLNRRFEKLFNAKSEDWIGKTDYDRFPKEAADIFRENDLLVLKREAPVEFEETVPQSDGPHIYISVKFPLRNGRGEIYATCGISTDITERKRTEEELRNSREQLRALFNRLQSIREEERTRIARNVHDEFSQNMVALKMDLSILETMIPKNNPRVGEKLKSMRQLILDTLDKVEKISADLRPAVLDVLGLTKAIEWHAKEFENRTGIKCKLSCNPKTINLDQDRATAMFRIFQEAMTNAGRHANATQINVTLKSENKHLWLKVEDNGKGISRQPVYDINSLGLLGIRERARMMGGDCEIYGTPGKGTLVTVWTPLHKHEN